MLVIFLVVVHSHSLHGGFEAEVVILNIALS